MRSAGRSFAEILRLTDGLIRRGAIGTKLVTSDTQKGLKPAVAKVLKAT